MVASCARVATTGKLWVVAWTTVSMCLRCRISIVLSSMSPAPVRLRRRLLGGGASAGLFIFRCRLLLYPTARALGKRRHVDENKGETGAKAGLPPSAGIASTPAALGLGTEPPR